MKERMKMKWYGWIAGLCCIAMAGCSQPSDLCEVNASKSDLTYPELAGTWDEAIPLGNATVGALVWQRDSALRFSLDRTDLWDLRASDSLAGDNFRFSWVKEHIISKDYAPVQAKMDAPYDQLPAPSKIPGAALEFPIAAFGKPVEVRLYLNNALCEVKWDNGAVMQTFVQADSPVGWFVFKNLPSEISPSLIPPVYEKAEASGEESPVSGQDLQRLGYKQGTVTQKEHQIVYHQKGYGDFSYDVAVQWKQQGKTLVGTWSVTSSMEKESASAETEKAMKRGLKSDYLNHIKYWNGYWAQSSVTLPDSILQRQYDNEMYKFGSASREHSYPISLQAVWTADNGKLPPWKGDYHHDLNTELSYWPAYAGNHLSEAMGYMNTLWNQRDVYKKFTRQYFGTDGMNVPGVCTLTGEPMGGWIQYSLSQTTAAWLSQHFYLQWKYSMDSTFLKERAYPFIKDVALFLEQITKVDKNGKRTLEFSSSPETFDNSLQAWFHTITNYDLAQIRFLFGAASELAGNLGLNEESAHWKELLGQMPDFDLASDGSLTLAKGFPYEASHRHFSHAMAIHPFGLIDWSDGEASQRIITATLNRLKQYGPDWWCGYSYSWFGCMNARAMNGEEAARYLRLFADCFCLKNTFHVNGDQSGTGMSKFTYRPFTLEGNFAFASGVQEMLLQSHTGTIRIFPAIPASWQEVSFTHLRAMGAFLISAERKGGKTVSVTIESEKGGTVKLISPFDGKLLQFDMKAGEKKVIER